MTYYDTEEATIRAPIPPVRISADRGAQLDTAHVGDIRGGFGTIREHDMGPRKNWWARFKTLLAILGPGLIVMVGDNDAGAFGTYTQAGQNYGTTLLWTLLMLIPVLYVNQEMVLRLGAVTGVGHARLILERFGRFWGAFSVIDLFVLNALTIVTEFIGLTLAFDYLGIPKLWGVVVSAVIIMGAASTGDFRRFERFSLVLVFGSLLLVPILFMAHPPLVQLTHDFLVPGFPKNGALADVMLLIIAIVGTTVAPWQLFFQRSYVRATCSRYQGIRRVSRHAARRHAVPDQNTIGHFRLLLEHRGLGKRLYVAVSQHLKADGIEISMGALVEASILGARHGIARKDPPRVDETLHQRLDDCPPLADATG
jgi:hypothetical protein